MTTPRIDWSSAQVTVEPSGFELQVKLATSTDISPRWPEVLNDLAAEHRGQEGQRWDSVELWGETIIVKTLEPGADEAIRAYLDELVESANDIAERRRVDAEKDAQAKSDTQQQQRQQADEMARRLRGK